MSFSLVQSGSFLKTDGVLERALFKLKTNLQLLYGVNCGRRGRAQGIHTDRIRIQLPQYLYDEAEDTDSLSENKYMPLDADSFDETKLESPDDQDE